MEFLSSSRFCDERGVTSSSSASAENVTIPEELTMYRRTYIDSGKFKHKHNKFTKSASPIFPENVTVITHQTVFLLDITGSMQNIINSVKKEIVPVMKRLKEEAEKTVEALPTNGETKFVLHFEVSIIGYRDFMDCDHFETHDFTSEISEIETFLAGLIARGGDDEPEDVKGSFIHALFGISDVTQKLSWKTDTASKSIFLITDAPAHGQSFHTTGMLGDRFLEDSEDEWQIILSEMKTNQISFNIIKINQKTTKMCEKFNALCRTSELQYTEIDISQQIEENSRSFGECRIGVMDDMRRGSREISTLEGHAETVLTSMYRMTSAGYATSRSSSHTTLHATSHAISHEIGSDSVDK